jgi:uncharacterized protein (TIGR00251 family)
VDDIIREHENGILFEISVKPNAKKQSVKASKKKGIVVSLINPPTGGNANRELITLLKTVTGSNISLYKTHKNHQKTLFAPDFSVRQFKHLMNIK